MRDDLRKLRKEIDKFDGDLLKIISKRFLVCQKISIIKKVKNTKIKDAHRERELDSLHQKLGEKLFLDSRFVKKLFKIVLFESKRIQSKIC